MAIVANKYSLNTFKIDILDIIDKEIVLIKFYFSRFSLISFLDTAFFLL